MKTTSQALAASAIILGFALFPVPAAATPAPVAEPLPLVQHAESFQQTAPDTFDVGATPAATPVTLPARGTFSVAIVPRESYPVADLTISSGFGARSCPEGPCSAFHEGVDFPGAHGAPVKSLAAGTVSFAGLDGNYGNKVTVEHVIDGIPTTTVYGHLADGTFAVSPGQYVERGQLLAGIGDTGRSYGDHLHFEVRLNGTPVNPVTWLASRDILPFP